MVPSETICALSTAPGIGAIALIRLSGNDAESIFQKIFSKDISSTLSHKAIHGWVMQEGQRLDEVVATIFRAPRSFTGETTIEIACHGSLFIQQKIIEALLENGAKMASPGEFTMRAYLNGKMDLSQAEAVGDLIASESAAAHKQALHQMRGGFSKEIAELRDRLIHFASLVELELDFAEEDVEFANRPQLTGLVQEITGVVEGLRKSFSLGNAIKNGVPVAIIGKPNEGKSTLLNALLNEERAIVSDIAGTTRDTVEDSATIGGIRFRFIDTAGIRDTQDTIEQMGIARAWDKARAASIVLYMMDAVDTSQEELKTGLEEIKTQLPEGQYKLLIIANKTDKAGFDENTLNKRTAGLGEVVAISAKNKSNIEKLSTRLLEIVESGKAHSGETIVTNARHYEALTKASSALADIRSGMDNGITGDFLAIDIRRTLYHLGEITGQINADDLLNSIFSRFCIGK